MFKLNKRIIVSIVAVVVVLFCVLYSVIAWYNTKVVANETITEVMLTKIPEINKSVVTVFDVISSTELKWECEKASANNMYYITMHGTYFSNPFSIRFVVDKNRDPHYIRIIEVSGYDGYLPPFTLQE